MKLLHAKLTNIFFGARKKSKEICRDSDGWKNCLHVINSSLHTIILLVWFELHAGRLGGAASDTSICDLTTILTPLFETWQHVWHLYLRLDNNSDTSILNFDTAFFQLHTSIWSWQQFMTSIAVKRRFDSNCCQAPFFLYNLSWLYREIFRTPKKRVPCIAPLNYTGKMAWQQLIPSLAPIIILGDVNCCQRGLQQLTTTLTPLFGTLTPFFPSCTPLFGLDNNYWQ